MNKRTCRAFNIVAAYFYAILGASVILVLSLMIRVALNDPGESLGYVLSVTFLLAILGAGIPPLMTLLMPALAIFIAEKASLRSWIYYAGAGALTGITVIYTTQARHEGDAHAGFFSVVVALSLLAGITGGLIYWKFAGRNAGEGSGESGESKV